MLCAPTASTGAQTCATLRTRRSTSCWIFCEFFGQSLPPAPWWRLTSWGRWAWNLTADNDIIAFRAFGAVDTTICGRFRSPRRADWCRFIRTLRLQVMKEVGCGNLDVVSNCWRLWYFSGSVAFALPGGVPPEFRSGTKICSLRCSCCALLHPHTHAYIRRCTHVDEREVKRPVLYLYLGCVHHQSLSHETPLSLTRDDRSFSLFD